jgi:hypothetical protein
MMQPTALGTSVWSVALSSTRGLHRVRAQIHLTCLGVTQTRHWRWTCRLGYEPSNSRIV